MANPTGKTLDNYLGYEKMIGWDESPDPPKHNPGGLPPIRRRKSLILPPPVYPRQKNLWPKIRARWLQKVEALRDTRREREKDTGVYEDLGDF